MSDADRLIKIDIGDSVHAMTGREWIALARRDRARQAAAADGPIAWIARRLTIKELVGSNRRLSANSVSVAVDKDTLLQRGYDESEIHPLDVMAAERWQALFNCSRVRVLGYARGGPQGRDGEIRHIGFEFTSDQEPYCASELQDGKDRLIEFTDALLSVRRRGADPCADGTLCRECAGDGICMKRNPVYQREPK